MNKKGFSLIELLVVIVLIAIISVVAFVNFGNQAPKGRNSVRLNDLSTITSALEIARADKEYSLAVATAGWESFDQDFLNLTAQTKLRDYLAKAPRDPSATSATSDDTYKIGWTSIGYQVAAALEVVGENSKLGAYDTSRVNSTLVGNFVPAAATVAADGTVTIAAIVADNAATTDVNEQLTNEDFGLIGSSSDNGATNAYATDPAVAATTLPNVVIDGSTQLPY